MGSINLKDISTQEKPRERLIKFGVKNLSNGDLLAIILKTGTKSFPVKELANKILAQIGNINHLKDITYNNLTNIKGIGPVKAIEIIAALELGRRVYYEKDIYLKEKLNNPRKIFEYFKYIINDIKQEHFYCLYLDNKGNLIEKKLLFIGTINMSVVHPREIFKHAYLLSATSIICVHNHPSGNPEPSKEDISLTKNIVEIGHLQGIKISDHIIVGSNKYYSFFENNSI